ncbi:MAG: hypothetical protein QMC05_02650 [Pseudomonadales bacterium]|jgi:hypothetical protein
MPDAGRRMRDARCEMRDAACSVCRESVRGGYGELGAASAMLGVIKMVRSVPQGVGAFGIGVTG